MNDKTKKVLTIVFTAVATLIISVTAVLLDIPASELLPDNAPQTSVFCGGSDGELFP